MPGALFGQGEKFTAALSVDQLTQAERDAAGLSEFASGTEVSYLRFVAPESVTADNAHVLELDDSGLTYAFDVEYYTSHANGGYSQVGHLAGKRFRLRFEPGAGHSGEGVLDGNVVAIESITETLSKIDRFPVPEAPEVTLFDDEEQMPAPEDTSADHYDPGCAAAIDVLFLRSAAADAEFPRYGGIYTFSDMVREVVRETNLTLQNSQVGPKVVTAKFHNSTVELSTASYECFTRRNALIADPYIMQLRQQYDADVVVYYDTDISGCSGVAGAIGGGYDRAYILNDINIELFHAYRFILNTHEIGHLLRGEHLFSHRFSDPQNPDDFRQTMMVFGFPHRDNVARHYSNPDVDYAFPGGDVPTGTTYRNNAARIATKACETANFESAGGFTSMIEIVRGPSIPRCFTSVPLCAEVAAGNDGGPNGGPYTYEWRWSIHPNAATTLFSTEECPTFTSPNGQTSTFYVTLTVTDVNSGQSTSSARVIRFSYCDDEYERSGPAYPPLAGDHVREGSAIRLQLNGNTRRIQLPFESLELLDVEVVSTAGASFGTFRAQAGQLLRLDAPLPPGLYFARATDGSRVANSPVWYVD